MKRLPSIALQSGDLLSMQGPTESIAEFAADNACVPLAQREFRIADKRKRWEASLIMLFAIGSAAFGLLPAAVALKTRIGRHASSSRQKGRPPPCVRSHQ